MRVNCVVPGWIGLERAHREVAAMPGADRARLPALVEPEQVARCVLDLLVDEAHSGRVVALTDGEHEPVWLS